MFDQAKFEVSLTIERLTRIPYTSGTVFIRWDVCESPRPDAHGRTKARKVHKTSATFNETSEFKQRIGIRSPSKYLRECETKLEVVWTPPGSRGVTIGNLSIDLSQFALSYVEQNEPQSSHSESGSKSRSNEAYGKSLLYILSGARTNCLLGIRVEAKFISGNRDYKVPEFNGPAVNFSKSCDGPESELIGGEKCGSSDDHPRSSDQERIEKLREGVFRVLEHEGSKHSRVHSNWMNLDNLLIGKENRLLSPEIYKDLDKNDTAGDVGVDLNLHKSGTPFTETEIRDNFITWNVFGSM